MHLTALQRVSLFPVRHHSPRASRVLRQFLEDTRPEVVLIEAPRDAEALIDVLVDAETRPPVAILGYRIDGITGSSLWPFADYSPELVAMRWAKERGVTVRFIDIGVGQALGLAPDLILPEEADEQIEGEDEAQLDGAVSEENGAVRGSIHDQIAASRGFRSFDEFWEASFEAPDYDADSFRAALFGYAELVRHSGTRYLRDTARDAFMAARILENIDAGTAPEKIAVVCGAAHAAAFLIGDYDPELETRLDPTVAAATTLIPFSYPRLAQQTGYGAGNRAPMYYQRAHDAGCSFRRATLEVLVDFCDHLRLRGFAASLADTIEAYRLACMLADIRGKAEPGLDEVREATVATMCRGDATHVDGFLWPSVVGLTVGRVASRVGKNSLQEEFWREVETRKLPRNDSPERFDLKLNNEVEVGTSIFLHRLRVADIPFAAFLGQKSPAMTSGKRIEESAGGVDALKRAREFWEAQWTPSTDVALVEKIIQGDSLEQVCERSLGERLSVAKTTGETAEVLLEAVVCSCPRALSEALSACDGFAATDDDLVSLARAAYALSSLAGSGKSLRVTLSTGGSAVPALLGKTFERAVLRVRDGCTGNDEAVAEAKASLRTLHEIAIGQPLVDKRSWLDAAHELVDSYLVNPVCAGLATGLLYLAGEIDADGVSQIVGQRLSNLLEPEAAAGFLGGLLEVNALVLVKNKPIVKALDLFLCAIPPDRFKDALPTLRRALGMLGPTERRYLMEILFSLHQVGDKVQEAIQIITESDKDKIKDAVKDLGDLDDLL